jgi:hypothetical protein
VISALQTKLDAAAEKEASLTSELRESRSAVAVLEIQASAPSIGPLPSHMGPLNSHAEP